MAAEKVQSFVGKFLSLWSTGEDVTLKITALKGKASVSMEVNLGDYSDCSTFANTYCDNKQTFCGGRSRQRRRERRANEREVKAEQVEIKINEFKDETIGLDAETVAAEIIDNKQVDGSLVSAEEAANLDIHVNTEEVHAVDVNLENTDKKHDLEEKNSSVKILNEVMDTDCAKTVSLEIRESKIDTDLKVQNYTMISTESPDTNLANSTALGEIEKTVAKSINTEINVYSKVNFDCCPNDKLSSSDLKTFEGILFRHEHLRRNIKKVEYGHYSTRKDSNDGLFTHVLDMRLVVDTTRLWETGRSYIWKFTGQDEWKLANGTMVSVNRIHTK